MPIFRPDRRAEARPEDNDRRRFPRPPLWLNLTILLLALGGIALANLHRHRVTQEYSDVLTAKLRTPEEINQMKENLAELNLTREQLEKELDGRKEFMQSLESENFYLSIDTEEKKLRFHYGPAVLREGDIQVGEAATIEMPDKSKSWLFVPVKGSFKVDGKVADHSWTIPEWVYLMKNEPIPAKRPTMRGGLGRYVIQLPSGYVIHSPPAEESPLDGPKPGSIMASEADLRAIWPRLHKETKVYIF